MAYVVVTEQQASDREFTEEGLTRLYDALAANVAVLKSGSRAVVAATLLKGTQVAVNAYPAISIEGYESGDTDATIGSADPMNRRLELRYRVWCYDYQQGATQDLTMNLPSFADRVRAVLIYNRKLDGWATDLVVPRIRLGRITAGAKYILTAQVEVIVTRFVERP